MERTVEAETREAFEATTGAPSKVDAVVIGARVTWTHRRQNGDSIELSTREGKVIALHGEVATVKGRGKSCALHVSKLRLAGQRTELTDFVDARARAMGLCGLR